MNGVLVANALRGSAFASQWCCLLLAVEGQFCPVGVCRDCCVSGVQGLVNEHCLVSNLVVSFQGSLQPPNPSGISFLTTVLAMGCGAVVGYIACYNGP